MDLQELQLRVDHDAQTVCQLADEVSSTSAAISRLLGQASEARASAVAEMQGMHTATKAAAKTAADAASMKTPDTSPLEAVIAKFTPDSEERDSLASALRALLTGKGHGAEGDGFAQVLATIVRDPAAASIPVPSNPALRLLRPTAILHIGAALTQCMQMHTTGLKHACTELLPEAERNAKRCDAATTELSEELNQLNQLVSDSKRMQAQLSHVEESRSPVATDLELAREELREAQAMVARNEEAHADKQANAHRVAQDLWTRIRGISSWAGLDGELGAHSPSADPAESCEQAVRVASHLRSRFEDALADLEEQAQSTTSLAVAAQQQATARAQELRLAFEDELTQCERVSSDARKELQQVAAAVHESLGERMPELLAFAAPRGGDPAAAIAAVHGRRQELDRSVEVLDTLMQRMQAETRDSEQAFASLQKTADELQERFRYLTEMRTRASERCKQAVKAAETARLRDRARLEQGARTVHASLRQLVDCLRGGSDEERQGIPRRQHRHREGAVPAIAAYAVSMAGKAVAGTESPAPSSKRNRVLPSLAGASGGDNEPVGMAGSLRLVARFDDDAEDITHTLEGLASSIRALREGAHQGARRPFEYLTLLGTELHLLARAQSCPDDATTLEDAALSAAMRQLFAAAAEVTEMTRMHEAAEGRVAKALAE